MAAPLIVCHESIASVKDVPRRLCKGCARIVAPCALVPLYLWTLGPLDLYFRWYQYLPKLTTCVMKSDDAASTPATPSRMPRFTTSRSIHRRNGRVTM